MLAARNRISSRNVTFRRLVAFVVFFFVEGSAGLVMAQGPQDYIVIFREGTNPAVRAISAGNAGAALRHNLNAVTAAAVRVPNPNALAALQNDPAVLSIIPDRPISVAQSAAAKGGNKGKPGGGGGGGGGGGSNQTVGNGVARVGLPTPSSNGSGVGVAVLDTGIDGGHADLSVAAESFTAFGQTCQDDRGHGTHVAGIVAALDNTIDVIGVAPGATLYCVKVLDQNGEGLDSDIMAGLQWVLDNHSTV